MNLSFAFFKRLLPVTLAFATSSALAADPYWDMESGSFEDYSWKVSGSPATFSRSSEPACSGNRSVKYELDYYNSPTRYRAEFTSIEAYGENRLSYFTEYWIGFNLYIPEDWKTEKYGEIALQVHQHPDPGETYRNPALTFGIEGDQWRVSWAANDDPIAPAKSYTARGEEFLSKVKKGTWNQIVLHFKTSYNNDGYYQAYINGTKEFDYSGPMFYNDQEGPYIKFGMYKPSWKQKAMDAGWGGIIDGITRRTYFQDDMKIFKGSNGLSKVQTSCGDSSTPIKSAPPLPPASISIDLL